jgi:hypothetical protein
MRNFIGIGLVLCLSSARAQNLVQNPQFDNDPAGWDLSEHATWSNRIDLDGSPTSGTLQISTGTTDYATQCIELRGDTRYAFSFWAEKDPQPAIAPCASPGHYTMISLLDGPQCAGSETSSFGTAEQRPDPDGWQHAETTFMTPAATKSGRLSLVGSCNFSSGIAIYYYDDIFIAPDAIFATDFEQHAPEGGPGQPPGG